MSKRKMLLGSLIVFLIVIGFLSMPQAKVADMPPGVIASMWVPLSDNSGILLSRDARPLAGSDRASRGTLFIKTDNVWHRFYLDSAPAAIMPVDR
jgi:hypothetical protein